MIIDKERLDIVRAQKCMHVSDIGVSKATLRRINEGLELKPYTVGRIAATLECNVTDLLKGGEAE